MSFRLVPKSVTVNDLERCNSAVSSNSIAFGEHYIKAVEDTPRLYAAET